MGAIAESGRVCEHAAKIAGSLRRLPNNPIFPIESVMRTHAGYALRQSEIFIKQVQSRPRPICPACEQIGAAILASLYAREELSAKPSESEMLSRAVYALRQAELLIEGINKKGLGHLTVMAGQILAGMYTRSELSATPSEPDMRICVAHAFRQAEVLHEASQAS